MRILFISTLNLATNPRFFKEIQLALDNGNEVEVICFEFDNWSHGFNQELKKRLEGARLNIIPAGRKPFLPWIISVCKEQFWRKLSHYLSLPIALQSKAVSRRSGLLVKLIKTLKGPYDLVIGHNPGALYPTWFAAQRFGARAGFDVEDYHPGEGSNKKEQAVTLFLMNALLPKMDYVSFAAPLIKERHIQDCGKEGRNWFTILNFFPGTDFQKRAAPYSDGPLKLVWFSQNINYKRGLEQIIPVLDHYKDRIELSLVGNSKEAFAAEFLQSRLHIKVIPPKDQKSLHQLIQEFDVGLAIEPGKDKNNFIALANKLITYFQAGLYILSSDTPAHIAFFKEHAAHGIATSLDKENIPAVLDKLLLQKNAIREGYERRFAGSVQYNWETESKKLLHYWKNILS